MAKGDQEKTMKAVGQEQTRQKKRSDEYLGGSQQTLGGYTTGTEPGGGLRGNISQGRQDLIDRFKTYASGSSAPPVQATGGSGGGGGGGGAAPGGAGGYDESIKVFRDLIATGGVDLSDVNDTIAKLKAFGATGGMSDADKANILRPHYYDMEKTGGYTPQQLADIKAESNSVIPSFYKNMSDDMNRRQAATGYGGGFGAAQASMARQGAMGAGDAARRTNIGLAESVREGKMSGADAIQRGQLGISDITGRNTLGAYGTAGQLGIGGQEMLQRGKITGAGGLSDITSQQAQQAIAREGIGASNSRAQAALDESRRQFDEGQKQFGVEGLAGLYGQDIGMGESEAKRQLDAMGLDADTQGNILSNMRQTAAMPGRNQQLFGNILDLAGTGAGAISGFGGMSGLGGLFKKGAPISGMRSYKP